MASARARVDARHGRVGAHAAGVRPLVAVEDALVVLGGRHRQRGLAVAQGQQRQLLALEVLLHDDAALAEAAGHEELVQRGSRLGLVGGDDDALARGEAVELQDDRVALDRGHPVGHGVDGPPRGGGHAGGLHDLLGEGLGALEDARPPASDRRRPVRARAARRPARRPAAPRGRRRSGRRPRARRARRAPRRRRRRRRTARASAAMPGLPGAHRTSGRWGERSRARTIACSRPPPPTTRTFRAPR